MIDPQEFFKKTFAHTRKDYWGGSWYPYWTLMLITVLGGGLALDHLWLRSPQSALLKIIVNVCTFGLWYFYDVIQIFKDKNVVMKHGLSAPFIGPLGIGAGVFRDTDPSGPSGKSPFRFLAYLILLALPFGFDFLVAGDTNGALAKFLGTIFFLMLPVTFLWGMVNLCRAWLFPQSVFEKGTYRMFPFSWFMDSYGPSVLGPKSIPSALNQPDACDPGGAKGFWRNLIGFLPPILQAAVNGLLPGVQPAVMTVAAATQAGATTAKLAAETAAEALHVAKDSALPALEKALDAAGAAAGPAAAALAAGRGVAKGVMRGGGPGGVSVKPDIGILSDGALLFVLAVILGGGAFVAFSRIQESRLRTRSQNERDDSPPRPQ